MRTLVLCHHDANASELTITKFVTNNKARNNANLNELVVESTIPFSTKLLTCQMRVLMHLVFAFLQLHI